MKSDERPASFQIPGRGNLDDHVRYHKMLLKEFRHTMIRRMQEPPVPTLSQGKKDKALKILKVRLNLHHETARRQLGPIQFSFFDAIFMG